MYVWRVPFPAFAAWATAVVLLCVVAALLWVRRRTASTIVRGLLDGAIVLAILASPAAVGALVDARAPRFYDPSPWLGWSPAIFVVCVMVFSALLFGTVKRARTDDDWEEFAQRDPYFAILTDDRFHANRIDEAAMREFFASGERDVDALLKHATQPPRSALDFGCGAGRLTLALAKRVAHVVGVDVSATMRELAERHATAAGIANARFVEAIPNERFDFICSLIVFQHIPVDRGEALFRELLGRLNEGGTATIELAFSRPGGVLKKLARRLRSASPLVHRIAQRLSGDRSGLPYMQMNVYDLERIRAIVREAGCTGPALIATRHGDIEGAIVVAAKAPATGSRSAR